MCPEAVMLLPSSESKTPGGRPGTRFGDARRDARSNRYIELEAAREQVAGAVAKLVEGSDEATLEEAFDAKGASLRHAVASNLFLDEAPVLPAVDRYVGALHKTLAFSEMPARAQEGFNERVLFLSGMFGAVSPSDLIPDYRARFDAAVPGLGGTLAEYWRTRLAADLAPLVRGRIVWNLLPESQSAAWAGVPDAAGEVSVRFVERRNGRLRSSTHWSKSLTGAFARHLATRGWGLQSAEKFENEGYKFDPSLSNVTDARGEMVFVKG